LAPCCHTPSPGDYSTQTGGVGGCCRLWLPAANFSISYTVRRIGTPTKKGVDRRTFRSDELVSGWFSGLRFVCGGLQVADNEELNRYNP
jgi:hypothetical protein